MSDIPKEADQTVPAAQLQFESALDQATHKMLVNYRALLKKYSSLAGQAGMGRHEPLQIDVACENIVSVWPYLLPCYVLLRSMSLYSFTTASKCCALSTSYGFVHCSGSRTIPRRQYKIESFICRLFFYFPIMCCPPGFLSVNVLPVLLFSVV